YLDGERVMEWVRNHEIHTPMIIIILRCQRTHGTLRKQPVAGITRKCGRHPVPHEGEFRRRMEKRPTPAKSQFFIQLERTPDGYGGLRLLRCWELSVPCENGP